MRFLARPPLTWIISIWISACGTAHAALPAVPVPDENPITDEKVVLGKILFWDEQLSSDNTVACGTCHDLQRAGADGRLAVHPGADGSFGGDDDVFGSFGIIRSDSSNQYVDDPVFGLTPQVTRRTSPSVIGMQWDLEAFWDGRAPSEFVDPTTGETVIDRGGALESQSLVPLLSTVEMSHEGRSFDDIIEKLERSRPLELASDWPPDVAAAIAAHDTYPELFEAAFGDPEISAKRIAFAIASYERILVPDQTPWDAYTGGQLDALTFPQINGMVTFQGTSCVFCHFPSQFTDSSYRNVGLRPIAEDVGRQEVTGFAADRGRFKVPTLRNVGLKNRFMHNGRKATLNNVVNFYRDAIGQTQFPENQDPFIAQVNVPPQAIADLVDFMENGLLDPRVAAGTPPFDAPTLRATVDACNDGLDNDGDGLTDFGDDPGCASLADPAEHSVLLPCDDGIDNDRDGVTDLDDLTCTDPTSPSEETGCSVSEASFALLLPPGYGLLRRRRRALRA